VSADHHVFTTTTRISDLERVPFEVEPIPRERWATGDYVVAELMKGSGVPYTAEHTSGRMIEAVAGDALVGALGRRAATLETAGDWRAVGADLRMSPLCAGGVLGRITSRSVSLPVPPALAYRGHAVRAGRACRMGDFAAEPGDGWSDAPVVLIIGTSMDAGKTVAAKAIIRRLKAAGARVAAAKLTGVARYRDVLAMRDAGADVVADFVDGGLPSTAVPPDDYLPALRAVLARLAAARPGVLVAEAGASPLEPYNGAAAMAELAEHVRCTVLCASDPYAVVGVTSAFEMHPDLVSGRATSTEAGIALVERLSGVPALNLLDQDATPALDGLLRERLGSSVPAHRASARRAGPAG
jgi:hypothetical protein